MDFIALSIIPFIVLSEIRDRHHVQPFRMCTVMCIVLLYANAPENRVNIFFFFIFQMKLELLVSHCLTYFGKITIHTQNCVQMRSYLTFLFEVTGPVDDIYLKRGVPENTGALMTFRVDNANYVPITSASFTFEQQ